MQNFFLGIGVNAFSEYFKTSIWAESYYYIDKAALNLKLPLHNLWLEAWVETGVFSFVVFAALWAVALNDLFKIYKKDKDYISLGLASGVLAFLVGGLLFCGYLGSGTPETTRAKTASEGTTETSRVPKISLCI